MATVTLTELWLNVAADLSDYESFQNVDEFRYNKARDGEVRALANGRLRAVLRGTTARDYDLKLDLCTRAQVDWLEEHAGTLLCVRDDRGRKFYAIYLAVAVEEYTTRNDYADVNLKLVEVTHSEEV